MAVNSNRLTGNPYVECGGEIVAAMGGNANLYGGTTSRLKRKVPGDLTKWPQPLLF